MADGNTSSIQQSQDAQTLDNLTSLQQPTAAEQSLVTQNTTARADVPSSAPSTPSQDTPSLYKEVVTTVDATQVTAGSASDSSSGLNANASTGAAANIRIETASSDIAVTAVVVGGTGENAPNTGEADGTSTTSGENSSPGISPTSIGYGTGVLKSVSAQTVTSESATQNTNVTVETVQVNQSGVVGSTLPTIIDLTPNGVQPISQSIVVEPTQTQSAPSTQGVITAVDSTIVTPSLSDSLIVSGSPGSSINNPAVISGISTVSLTETNVVLTASGSLSATDSDSSNAFVAQTSVAGSNGYGAFSIGTSGDWTYTADSAHNEFVGGTTYTDSVTVATVDGTTQVITVSILGTNDAAVITGTSTASLTESNAALTVSGSFSATDVDSSNAFVAQTDAAGSNGYGTFSINSAGAWTYTANSAHNEFVGGTTYTDSITVATADGTTQVITVSILGTNDAAVITGTSTASLTETNAALTTSGTLTATDADSSNAFVAQTNVAGSNNYGTFSIDTNGAWTYTANSAHNEFVGGTTYTDSITVATVDGTTHVITVSILGTNDAAVISGTSTAALTESNVALTASGSLTATDVDSSNAFVAQTDVAGSNGYGTFSIGTNGAWTYTANSAHNEFVGGTTYTDSVTVATVDGTTQVITVSILGTNDAAVITGISTASLTETNAVLSASGSLSATDVDSSNAFVAQTDAVGSNGYGTFSIGTNGAWTYTADSAHNEFVGGTTYTDSITVATVDGTTQVITVSILGTNDAAVITGTSTAALTESNEALTASGTLTATDADSSNAFVAQTDVAGSNGYGTFSIGTNGAWTYTANSAHNEFVGGTTYTDSITVATVDGTTQVITVSILGTNDAAVITGTSTASLTETNEALTTSGTLTATDADSSNAFVAQTNAAGSNNYGTFSIDTNGAWTYTANSAHNEFVGGTTYTDSITVATADGTTQVITVSILGTNDATVITGTSTASLTETNAVLSTSGSLTATDADSSSAFVAQTGAAGSNGYGTFSIDSSGSWTYTANTAHNEFVGGTTYTDSITFATVDGTTKVVTVSILGTNDAAVISGTTTQSLTETNSILTTSGTLTSTDVDGTANSFQAQSNLLGSNGYGTFNIAANGSWTYATTTAHDEFVAGTTYTDTAMVYSADGTPQLLTVNILGTAEDTTPPTIVGKAVMQSSGGINTLVTTFSEGVLLNNSTGITVTNSLGSVVSSANLSYAIGASGNTLQISATNKNMPLKSGSTPLTYTISFNNIAIKDASNNFLASTTVSTPIALDLDGNGVSYLDRSAGVTYDYDGDGIAETTAWVAPSDGLLAHQSEDGKLTISFSTQAGETDLQGLAKVYDSNQDGVLDSKDIAFSQFGVWQDSDSNAIAGSGEFKTLTDAGITSISLEAKGETQFAANGDVIVYGETTYTTTDGSKHIAQDVGFASSENLQVSTVEPVKTATQTDTNASSNISTNIAAPVTATAESMVPAVVSSDTTITKTASSSEVNTGMVEVKHELHPVDSTAAVNSSMTSSQEMKTASTQEGATNTTSEPIHLELGGVTYVIEPNLTSSVNANAIVTDALHHVGDPVPLIPGAWTELVVTSVSQTPVAGTSWTEAISNPTHTEQTVVDQSIVNSAQSPAATEIGSVTETKVDHTLSNPMI